MKGATTEPLVSTIRPPKMVISTKTGRSQNFFRAIMNAAMSFRNDIIPSEWLFQRLRGRAPLVAHDPIGLAPRPPQAHGIDPERPHHQAGRDNRHDVHAAKK